MWIIYAVFACIYWESSTAWRGEISLSCTLLKLQFDVSHYVLVLYSMWYYPLKILVFL